MSTHTMNTTPLLSATTFYLAPVLAQVALPYFVAALILVTRLRDIFVGTATARFYEDYSGVGGPVMVQRTTNQLTNLFEFPILFFALVTIAIAANFADPLLQQLAWAFVITRWLHTFIHLSLNKLWVRMTVFMLSNLVLLGMWVRLALAVFGFA